MCGCVCVLYIRLFFCYYNYYNNLMKCITYSTLLLLLSHPTHKSTNCNVQSPVNNYPNPQHGCNCCIKWPANQHWPTGLAICVCFSPRKPFPVYNKYLEIIIKTLVNTMWLPFCVLSLPLQPTRRRRRDLQEEWWRRSNSSHW